MASNLSNQAKRAKTHCKRGHPFAGENLSLRNDGRRICKKCRKINAASNANAKLIAAAPDMLEALQTVLSGISRIPEDVLDEITFAIRKATQ